MKEEELETRRKNKSIPRVFGGGWAQGMAAGREGREVVPWCCTILTKPDLQGDID